MSNQSIQFLQGKKKTRGELRLPALHFIATDDWTNKIGDRAFVSWLKFYTWADRRNPNQDADAIPKSLAKVAKKLSISRETLYNQIIRPLWNFGFIDLQEIEIHGNTCVNIVVYEYPLNDPDKATKPLEQVRDYDKDYQSTARSKAQTTAKKRQKKNAVKPRAPKDNSTLSKNSTTTPVLKMDNPTCPKTVQPPVLKMDNPCTENGHNNVLNPVNDSESLFNVSESVSNVQITEQPAVNPYTRLTDRLGELQFGIDLKKQLITFTGGLGLTDEQALIALDMTIQSGRADKLHYWPYLSKVYKEKAAIAKAGNVIQATQQAGQKKGIIEDELPMSVKRQLEREAEEARLKAEGIETPATPAKTVYDDPELAQLMQSLEKQREEVKGNRTVTATPDSAREDEKPF